MNFEFSDEQEMLRDQARRMLREQCTYADVRRVLENNVAFDHKLWRHIVEAGWPATAIPEQYGGVGMGYLELCVIAEELGRALAPLPFSSSIYLAAETLLVAATPEQRSHYLPLLATGDAIGTLALAEGSGSICAATIATEFNNGHLNGRKLPVPDGDVANLIIVAARDGRQGVSLFLVEPDAKGLTRTTLASIDNSRNHAQYHFDNTPAQRIGKAGDGERILEQVFDRAAVLYAFEQLGGAQAALQMALDYAKQRYAFGRPIGSFQAIKHKLADMYCLLELARSNCYYAAWALSTGAAELPLAAATARVSATRAYHECAKENIHIHGGMGFTWEADCHLHYRRSKLLGLILGNEIEWKQKMVKHIKQQRAAA